MTREEYINLLEEELSDIPEGRMVIDDVKNQFEVGLKQGDTQERIIERLGDPYERINNCRAAHQANKGNAQQSKSEQTSSANTHTTYYKQQAGARSVVGAIGIAVMLLFLNACIAVPIIVTIFSLWFALLASGAAMTFAGVLSALAILVNFVVPLPYVAVFYPVVMFFACIAVGSLGAMIVLGLNKSGRHLGMGLSKYIRWNIDAVVGRRSA